MHVSTPTSALIFFLRLTAAQTAVTTITEAPPPGPTAEPEWTSDDSFASAVLNSTNHYREQHNASDVSWNGTLADFAAEHLDRTDGCALEHSGGPFGENLAKGYPDVTLSIGAWGEERRGYDFHDGGFGEGTGGHFTQLVWKNTTDVGCGRKLCDGDDEGAWYLVCEYWPRGNVAGQFREQVQEEESVGSGNSPGMMLSLFVAGSFAMWMTAERAFDEVFGGILTGRVR